MKKTIGFTSIFCISAGAMISSGLFVLPGLAFAKAGPAVSLSYLVAGCIALTTVLSLSELITAMPKSGGDYYYVSRTFGQLFGTVSGLLSWLALSLKSAFAVIGIAELIYLTFNINLTVSAIILAILFTGLNLFGVKEALRFQVVLVIALICILISFFAFGIQDIVLQRFEPFLTHGANALFSTAGFVFVSFGGVLTTASIAGEVKNPARNIPLGLIASTVTVTILYTLITFVVVGMIDAETLKGSLAPIAEAARTCQGKAMFLAIMAGSLLAFITTANGGILTASRYPVALANDNMLPPIFSRTAKSGTPFIAIVATGALIAVAVTLKLDLLVKAASAVILLSNIFAHLSVIVMRESRIGNYRPTFKAPFYPWLQIAGIIAFTLLIINMGIQPILISLLFILAGVVLYFVRRAKSDMVSPALLHLVQRITNKEMISGDLSSELRDIVENRDGIVKDEFDLIVEESSYLELDKSIDIEELWKHIAAKLHTSLPQHSEEQIATLLREREADGSTAISSYVAVPHIIVKGDTAFKILFIRAPQGICFSDEHPSVKAVFVLIGTKDMRRLHLRALAGIAQVVQGDDFEKSWNSARSHRGLKDLFLVSKRKRNK
ncbi:MAG: amino acid permease [Kiritimatiellae bacterium]|jgi:APA family basic amino acid/polyamine antiporter|nr:amino acid permease [Kiritimatiellia bacterium]